MKDQILVFEHVPSSENLADLLTKEVLKGSDMTQIMEELTLMCKESYHL